MKKDAAKVQRTVQRKVCGHRRYYRIVVQREHRPAYRTAFYGCFGCSTMFTDPYKFTQSVKPRTKQFGSASYDRSREH